MKFIGWPVLFTTAIDCNHIIPQFWLHHKQNSLFSGKVSLRLLFMKNVCNKLPVAQAFESVIL